MGGLRGGSKQAIVVVVPNRDRDSSQHGKDLVHPVGMAAEGPADVEAHCPEGSVLPLVPRDGPLESGHRGESGGGGGVDHVDVVLGGEGAGAVHCVWLVDCQLGCSFDGGVCGVVKI